MLKPQSLLVDLGELRPGAETDDYFHAILYYGKTRRVVLHATALAAAESARFIVHGTKGSYVKFGLDPQEDRLKAGEKTVQENWGQDKLDGMLTLSNDGIVSETRPFLTIAGNYPAYYAALRDAINGVGKNPVTASDAIEVMELIELGMESSMKKKAMPVTNANLQNSKL
jgi:predicted dehydrogenase